MKSTPSATAPRADTSTEPRTGRRLVVGAGIAAGAALAVAAVQRRGAPQEKVEAARSDPAAPEGYRLTDHIRRYYETTRT